MIFVTIQNQYFYTSKKLFVTQFKNSKYFVSNKHQYLFYCNYLR